MEQTIWNQLNTILNDWIISRFQGLLAVQKDVNKTIVGMILLFHHDMPCLLFCLPLSPSFCLCLRHNTSADNPWI